MALKNLIKHLLFILIGLFFAADILFYYYPSLNFIAIILLLYIAIYKVSFLKETFQFNLLILYIIYISVFSLIHISTFDYVVFSKYILLGTFIIIPLKTIDLKKQIFYSQSINFLFYTLLIIGLIQLIILYFSFGFIQFEGHSRPIGFSTEPTWFSQQLVVLFFITKYLNNKFSTKNLLLFDLLFFFLVLVTFTRTTILALFFWHFFRRNYLKLFYLIFLTSLFIWIFSDSEFIEPVISKLNNQSNFQFEPRVIAFYESLALLKESNNLIGEGFGYFIGPKSGLTIGSYYAVLPISFVYVFGISSFFPFLLILFSYLNNKKRLSKIIILTSLFFSLFMPYLLSVYSFYALFISKTFVDAKP